MKKYLVSGATGGTARITIGRKADCDISFPNDKSVSRNHAELHLSANGIWSVIDLKSSFKTYIRSGSGDNLAETIVPPMGTGTDASNVLVNPGDEIKFGVAINGCGSRITFSRVSCCFCPTKLEKAEKNVMKEFLREAAKNGIGAADSSGTFSALSLMPSDINNSNNSNTSRNSSVLGFVVATKFSATVKILEALVARCPIVNLKYVELFAQCISAQLKTAAAISTNTDAGAGKPSSRLFSLPDPLPHFPALSHPSSSVQSTLALDRRTLFLEHWLYFPRPETDVSIIVCASCVPLVVV